MKNMYQEIKKNFEALNLTSQIKNLNSLKEKAFFNYQKKSDSPLAYTLVALMLSIPILTGFTNSAVYPLTMAAFTFIFIFVALSSEDKMKSYFEKKIGYTYSKDQLLIFLEKITTQATIINYFNVINQSDNEMINIGEENKTLKNAFMENDYNIALETIELILNKIENMHAQIEQINKEKQKLENYEKTIGAISLNSSQEIELEVNGNLKRYL